jgi:hypothetical protein
MTEAAEKPELTITEHQEFASDLVATLQQNDLLTTIAALSK